MVKLNQQRNNDEYHLLWLKQKSLSYIHFKQIICIFSSKKKNVELNLMFISQANNIGNSEIPVFALRYLSYTASFISSRGCRKKQCPELFVWNKYLKNFVCKLKPIIIESYTESNESQKITRLRNPIVCFGLFHGVSLTLTIPLHF
jgi:hypothetical protein